MNFFKGRWFLYSILLLLVLPSIIWIFLDHHVWPWDPSWYGEVSVKLYYNLTHSFSDWVRTMIIAFGVKAPAIAWIGQFFVPFSLLTGSVDRALLLSIITAEWVALVLIYKTVLHLTNGTRSLAFLASLMVAGAPLMVGLSHHYFVETWQLLAVVIFLFIVVRVQSWNRYTSILAVIFVSSFAMLVKITSPLYIFTPAAIFVWYFLKQKNQISLKDFLSVKKNWIFVLLVFVILVACVGWYAVNGGFILEFMRQASSGHLADLYGSSGSLFTKLHFWGVAFGESFFVPISMIFLPILFILFLVKIIRFKDTNHNKNFSLLSGFSLIAILLVLGVFSFQVNEETRYLLPIIPYVVICVCYMLYRMNSRWLNVIAFGVFMLQFFIANGSILGVVQYDTWRIPGWNTKVELNRDSKELVDFIIQNTCQPNIADRINVIGVEYPSLNANSLGYYSIQQKISRGYQCYYTSLGYAATNVEEAYGRLKNDINPPYFITSSEAVMETNAFNAVSAPVVKLIEKDPDFEELKLARNSVIRIFRSRK